MKISLLTSIKLACLLCLLVLSACSKTAYEQAGIKLSEDALPQTVTLAQIMILPASLRAAEYTANSHYQLLAYYDAAGQIKIPGVEQIEATPWRATFGIELVPYQHSETKIEVSERQMLEQEALQKFFLNYATEYNQEIIRLFRQKKKQ